VVRTLKLESSITTTRVPSGSVTCTSYAAVESELSFSVDARDTELPLGRPASAAVDAEVRVVPVSAVSPEPLLDELLELELDEFVVWRVECLL
jgi:hypothetical protein